MNISRSKIKQLEGERDVLAERLGSFGQNCPPTLACKKFPGKDTYCVPCLLAYAAQAAKRRRERG